MLGVVCQDRLGLRSQSDKLKVAVLYYCTVYCVLLGTPSDVWESVEIVMKKPPANVDCANVGIDPESIKEETVLYDGPTRGICPKFPRNVNTHASIGAGKKPISFAMPFLYLLKMINLPRQARDTHRENSNRDALFAAYAGIGAKNAIFSEFSLCLSRSCLGKMIVLYINGSKIAFCAGFDRTQVSRPAPTSQSLSVCV